MSAGFDMGVRCYFRSCDAVVSGARICVLAFTAVALLIFFDVALRVFKFRLVSTAVNRFGAALLTFRSPNQNPTTAISEVSRAVEIARSFFWKGENDCLPRALTIFCFLLLYGVPCTFLLGVRQFPFKAHSWVESCNRPIQEKEARIARFTTVWQMGSPRIPPASR